MIEQRAAHPGYATAIAPTKPLRNRTNSSFAG
jgi:hypothetical protein